MNERLFVRLDEDASHGPETDVPGDTLRAYEICAALQPFVSHILLYRERFAERQSVCERVLPDGAVRMVFHFGDLPSNGPRVERAAVLGAAVLPVVVNMRGAMHSLSVTLRPGAASALFGVCAGELASAGAVPLTEVWRGGSTAALVTRMFEARDDAECIAALQAALARQSSEVGALPDQPCVHASRLIVGSEGRLALRKVAAAVGVGERRLQQLFHAHLGLTPRAWSRLSRLHGCVRTLRRFPEPHWPTLAIDAGFYDQSHLVNGFRVLSGLSPGQFLSRSVSGSSKTI